MRAFRFPRATLPIASNLRELLLFLPTLAVMIVLILVIPPFEHITWRWLLLVPLLALQTLFNLGLSLLLARVVARWADVANLITFGTRIWLYLSAVFFSVQRFEHVPALVTAMHLNPMYCVLDIASRCSTAPMPTRCGGSSCSPGPPSSWWWARWCSGTPRSPMETNDDRAS